MPRQIQRPASRTDSATVSGRIEIYSNRFAQAGYPPLPEHVEPVDSPLGKSDPDFPLVLTSFRLINYCDQQHRNIPRLRRGIPDPVVELHPDVAAQLDIKTASGRTWKRAGAASN